MKQQIERLSPHQNGKVFGVLMALGAFVFAIPMFLIFMATAPKESGPPAFMFLLFPVMYLIFGYLSVAIGCWIYNAMFKYIGGIEFEAKDHVS